MCVRTGEPESKICFVKNENTIVERVNKKSSRFNTLQILNK